MCLVYELYSCSNICISCEEVLRYTRLSMQKPSFEYSLSIQLLPEISRLRSVSRACDSDYRIREFIYFEAAPPCFTKTIKSPFVFDNCMCKWNCEGNKNGFVFTAGFQGFVFTAGFQSRNQTLFDT